MLEMGERIREIASVAETRKTRQRGCMRACQRGLPKRR